MKVSFIDSGVLVTAALSLGAEEFITTEKPTKPMFRVSDINVISILD
jgi:hypothetical protein